MIILRLALMSLWNRRDTVLMTVLGIAVSVALLLGIEKLRTDIHSGFVNTISGADLIVGARGGPVNLLLYSIFHLGDATSDISWATYRTVASHPEVAWTIPLSLGDSHRGYRVLGTNLDYFEHYRYAHTRKLILAQGHAFQDPHDAVIGAEIADALGYTIGHEIVLSHGLGEISFVQHEGEPFVVAGILARTGTPADRTILVSLEAVDALHAPDAHEDHAAAPTTQSAPSPPQSITAFIVGLENRAAALQVQRAINEFRREPLLAILPGVTLQELWTVVGMAEGALKVVAACTVFAGLLGMLTSILTSLGERRREMAILRSVGAGPAHVFLLLMSEAALVGVFGVLAGWLLIHGALAFAQPALETRYGIFLSANEIRPFEFRLGCLIVIAAIIAGALPAWRAYRNTLADGLTIRT